MKSPSFTKINLALLTCSPAIPNLYPYITCTTWGVLVSFNLTYLLNPKAMIEFNKKQNNRLVMGNIITHIIPAGITLLFPPKKIKFKNGIGGALIHISWGLWVSSGTLILNKHYTTLPPNQWYILWGSAMLTELLTPKLFNSIYKLKY